MTDKPAAQPEPSAAAKAWANEGKGPLENYPDSAGFYTEREYERRGREWAATGYDAGAAAKAQEQAAEIERLRRALVTASGHRGGPRSCGCNQCINMDKELAAARAALSEGEGE